MLAEITSAAVSQPAYMDMHVGLGNQAGAVGLALGVEAQNGQKNRRPTDRPTERGRQAQAGSRAGATGAALRASASRMIWGFISVWGLNE
jgi:hypothetical protein